MKKLLAGALLAVTLPLCAGDAQTEFVKSFIKYYDFSTVGRYTHEYHPFLFKKSSYSLDALEDAISDAGMTIKGRVVIAGYEEQAVPSYLTNYKVCTGSKINDEAQVRGKSGFSEQLHNKFGLMTGFLFRDIRDADPLFEHINLRLMPIYDYNAWIFQKHAFGSIFPLMLEQQKVMNFYMAQKNDKKIFAELITFWQSLYEHEIRFGSRNVLGTQDVLFSIAHAQHLFRSSVPLYKYYVGPDITYPIKVTSLQKKAATRHAQTFVRRFSKNLRAIDDEKTVYIFCSFVDGVGKSTLLGNTQNYKKYGENFHKYDAVDNSSSQLAELYEYGEKVFIADLPAQMSHFTYKPDGLVYCDPLAAGASEDELLQLEAFLRTKRERYLIKYEALLKDVRATVKRAGWFEKSLCDPARPARAFAKNVLLLDSVETNRWIPFEYNRKHYLFHRQHPKKFRQLFPLESADSLGLKNFDGEQMLFLDGVRFPLPYKKFIADLLGKLQERGIKNVVFVDFLSMYPRSSRENIRINYLLQQLSVLHKNFSVEQSSYGTFINDAHLLRALKYDKEGAIADALRKETLVRLALYDTMCEQQFDTIDAVPFQNVTKLIVDQVGKNSPPLNELVNKLVQEKMSGEISLLMRVHGKTKNFVNVQEIRFDELVKFNKKLQQLLEKEDGWHKPGVIDTPVDGMGRVNKQITLSNGEKVDVLYVVEKSCRDALFLAPVFRLLRASWYASIANLLDKKYFVAPIWIAKEPGGKFVVFRRPFKKCEQKLTRFVEQTIPLINMTAANNAQGWSQEKPQWGIDKDTPYLLNVEHARTDSGLFAFGSSGESKRKQKRAERLVSYLVHEAKEKFGTESVLPTTDLWKKVSMSYGWKRYVFGHALKKAQKEDEAAEAKKKKPEYFKTGQDKKEKLEKQQLRLGSDKRRETCQKIVRALATLELVLKDVDGDVAIRRGKKKDFVAALKLIEKIVLPTYFNIIFEKNLFEDYNVVVPLTPTSFF